MFYGSYEHNIDKKGRLIIPSKYREELGEKCVICKGVYGNPHLSVYSNEQWDELAKRILSYPVAKSNKARHYIFDSAFDLEFDTQGRILIPPSLRSHAALEGAVHITGMGSKIELWNLDQWNSECEAVDNESIASILEELDF